MIALMLTLHSWNKHSCSHFGGEAGYKAMHNLDKSLTLFTMGDTQERKKTLKSSQNSNLGSLNSGQMLLPMSYWSYGIGAEDRIAFIHRHSSILRLDLS